MSTLSSFTNRMGCFDFSFLKKKNGCVLEFVVYFMCILLTDNDVDRIVVVVFRFVIAEMNLLKHRRCHHHYRNKSEKREREKKLLFFNFIAMSVAIAILIWCQTIQGLKYISIEKQVSFFSLDIQQIYNHIR